MELRHLRYFVMAADEGSISRAAARLNITQPAVSRQIHDLEEEFGVALFKRESGGLRLTAAGESALPLAKDLLRRAGDLTGMMQAFNRPAARLLRIGFIPTALPGFLAAALRTFNRQQKSVCVQIRGMSPNDQEAALRAGEIDVALLGTPRPQLAAEFKTETIKRTPMAVVLPDDHALASRKSLDLAELAGEPFVTLHEKHFPGRPEMLAELTGRAGFKADVRLKAEGLQEMLGLVAGGAGVGVLPADVHQLPHPGAVIVTMRKPKLLLLSSAVWRADREDDAVRSLIRLLKEAADRDAQEK